jgi:K+-transporting ATPase, c chain
MRLPAWVSQHLAALRALLLFTVVVGLGYPLAMVAVANVPGLDDPARGSLVDGSDSDPVGSRIIGQAYVDGDGNPVADYFQSRPSAAGDGYDPTSTSASNLGPESMEDTLRVPGSVDEEGNPDEGTQSLLTQVCARSLAVGELEGVDGSRPYCTDDGVGAVLRVFYSEGLTGGGYPRSLGEPSVPGHAVPRHLPGCAGGMWPARRGLHRRGAYPGSRCRTRRAGGTRGRGHRQRFGSRSAHQQGVRQAPDPPGSPGTGHGCRRDPTSGR